MSVMTEADIAGFKKVGMVVASALKEMTAHLRVGVTTAELDEIGARILARYGAQSAPKLTYNFPTATCISINEEVAHGVPGARVIQAGDIVNIDVSAELDGYFADNGATTPIAPVSKLNQALCDATRLALTTAISRIRAGRSFNIIGETFEEIADRKGFGIITNLCSHGVGRTTVHDEPKYILPYFDPEEGRCFFEGQVIAVEPFFTTGPSFNAQNGPDGWAMLGMTGHKSAQYENTILITKGKPIILTQTEE